MSLSAAKAGAENMAAAVVSAKKVLRIIGVTPNGSPVLASGERWLRCFGSM
jgi:hypothetical protein